MTKRRSTGPAREGTGPWLGVRDVNDPYAVPPDYLRDASNVYLPDGKGGSGAYARPGFRRVIVLPGSQVSDAIVRGTLVWVDSMSAGKAQSIGGGLSDRIYGRYVTIGGTFDFADTGGPDGGGQVTATAATSWLATQELTTEAIADDPTLGPPSRLGAIISDTAHKHGSLLVWHNLQQQVIASPTKILDLAHMRVMVNADRTITVQWHENPNGFTDVWHTIETSTLTVPSNGWFLLEYQWGISPLNYNKGGFFKARRYIPALTPVIGESILSTVGTRTRGEFASTIEHSFPGAAVYVPQHTSVGGVGMLVPTGAAPRWCYELYLGTALPAAIGDTVQSDIHYSHQENYANDSIGNPQLVGTDLVWGDSDRSKNVRSITRSASSADEPLESTVLIGSISASATKWTVGPTYPPDPIVRNSLRDAAMDLMRVSFNKPHAEIIALGPFALAAWRVMVAFTSGLGGGFNLPWVFTGPNPHVTNIGPSAGGAVDLSTIIPGNLAYELVMKLATGALVTSRGSIGNSEWRTLPGWQTSLPGVTEGTWLATALPQPGIRGDFRVLDAINGLNPANRWMETDVAQLGLDIAYRKRPAPAAVVEPQPPLADFIVTVNGLSHGAVTIQDASVDFNGDENATVTGVTSRVINWGDGTASETIGTGPSHQVSHQYALHGTYAAALTATNAGALSNTKTMNFVVPVGVLTAGFSLATNVGDGARMTIDFTDVSVVANGTIASHLWTFGDGNTSTATNPTHAYVTPGTYTVRLDVVDDVGQTANSTGTVTVPVVSGCGLSGGHEQAEDFRGGAAPFPAYASTAQFRGYLYRTTVSREWYFNSNGSFQDDDIDYAIDTTVQFHGGPTLKMQYGVASAQNYLGAGAYSLLTDNGNPSENLITSLDQWYRVIWKAQAGLYTGGFGPSDTFAGLGFEMNNHIEAGVFFRNGHFYLDVEADATTSYDLGVDTAFIGRSSGFGELIIRLTGDTTAHTLQARVWAGDACSLSGVSPIANHTVACHLDPAVSTLSQFEADFTPSGALKAIWVALAETTRESIHSNPYGVALT